MSKFNDAMTAIKNNDLFLRRGGAMNESRILLTRCIGFTDNCYSLLDVLSPTPWPIRGLRKVDYCDDQDRTVYIPTQTPTKQTPKIISCDEDYDDDLVLRRRQGQKGDILNTNLISTSVSDYEAMVNRMMNGK